MGDSLVGEYIVLGRNLFSSFPSLHYGWNVRHKIPLQRTYVDDGHLRT